MRKLSIAIDGPAGAGKSSVSKILASRLGYAYLDTGAMYRAVTYEALKKGLTDPAEITAMTKALDMEVKPGRDAMHVIVDGEDVTPFIRTPEVSGRVSEVSAIGGVRTAMVAIQRRQAEKGGIVLDGRDIGTTVLPKADVKIFLTATPEARATRRWKEYQAKGIDTPYEEVLADVKQRDYQDTHRAAAPLKQADDAVLLDTSELDFEQSLAAMKKIIAEKVNKTIK